MLFNILYFSIIVNYIRADEESKDIKYIDAISDKEKKNFIENIARRIIDEVNSKANLNDTGSKELIEHELNKQSEYVSKLLKEEAKNLRKNYPRSRKETEKSLEEVVKSQTEHQDKIENRSDEKTKQVNVTLPNENKEITTEKHVNDDLEVNKGIEGDVKEQSQQQESSVSDAISVTTVTESFRLQKPGILDRKETSVTIQDSQKELDTVIKEAAKEEEKFVNNNKMDEQKDQTQLATSEQSILSSITEDINSTIAGDKVVEDSTTEKSDNVSNDIKERVVATSTIVSLSDKNSTKLEMSDFINSKNDSSDVTNAISEPVLNKDDKELAITGIIQTDEANSKDITTTIDVPLLNKTNEILRKEDLTKTTEININYQDVTTPAENIKVITLPIVEDLTNSTQIAKPDEETKPVVTEKHEIDVITKTTAKEETITISVPLKDLREIKALTENVTKHSATETIVKMRTEYLTGIGKYVTESEWAARGTQMIIDGSPEEVTNPPKTVNITSTTISRLHVVNNSNIAKKTTKLTEAINITTTSEPLTANKIIESEPNTAIKIKSKFTGLVKKIHKSKKTETNKVEKESKHKINEYVVHELLPGQDPFKLVFPKREPTSKIKKPKDDSLEDRYFQIEQPKYATLYNYASTNKAVNQDSNEVITKLKALENAKDELFVPKHTKNRNYINKKLLESLASIDKGNKIYSNSNLKDYLRARLPDSSDEEHPRNAMVNQVPPPTHLGKVEAILNSQGYHGAKYKKTTTDNYNSDTESTLKPKDQETPLKQETDDGELNKPSDLPNLDVTKKPDDEPKLSDIPNIDVTETPSEEPIPSDVPNTDVKETSSHAPNLSDVPDPDFKETSRDIGKSTTIHPNPLNKLLEEVNATERQKFKKFYLRSNSNAPQLINIKLPEPKLINIDDFLNQIGLKRYSDKKQRNIEYIVLKDTQGELSSQETLANENNNFYFDNKDTRLNNEDIFDFDNNNENPDFREYSFYNPSLPSSDNNTDSNILYPENTKTLPNSEQPKEIFELVNKLKQERSEIDKIDEVVKPPESNDFDVYLNVLKDMIKLNNMALKNYDWLGTTVDIRAAMSKLLDLSESLKKSDEIPPKEYQILKYMLYIYQTAGDTIVSENDHESRKALVKYIGKKKKYSHNQIVYLHPWLARTGMEDKVEGFQDFLKGIETGLNDLHDAIKHIAMITKYKKQNWFENLKDLYLKDLSRKQLLEILLHLFTTTLLGLVEDGVQKGLEDSYIKYVISNSEDVEKIKNVFSNVIALSNIIKEA